MEAMPSAVIWRGEWPVKRAVPNGTMSVAYGNLLPILAAALYFG